jgi:glycosyltransferase involved in cell wall biosynthesis
MAKALWLTSWYPNKLDAFNGDFIQRHAKAASLFNQVYVIHLEPDKENVLTVGVDVSVSQAKNLTEVIVLYRLVKKFGVIGKWLSYLKYLALFKRQIIKYIAESGVPDVVHVHVPIKAGILALWIKKRYGVPFVVTEHWAIYNSEAPDAFYKRNFLFKRASKKILQQASAFTPVSNNLGKSMQKMVVDVPFTVIPNVADTLFFNYNDADKIVDLPFTFVHASTLKYQKNPQAIIRAFKQFLDLYPASKLVIAGQADDELIKYVSSLNIPAQNIQFTGWLGYVEVAAIMKQADAFVLFSRYENLPCVIIEALCSGLPVISTSVGGINEIIDGTNGVLINSQQESALLQAMIDLHDNYKNYHRAKIAENALLKFSYAVVGETIANTYAGIKRT